MTAYDDSRDSRTLLNIANVCTKAIFKNPLKMGVNSILVSILRFRPEEIKSIPR